MHDTLEVGPSGGGPGHLSRVGVSPDGMTGSGDPEAIGELDEHLAIAATGEHVAGLSETALQRPANGP